MPRFDFTISVFPPVTAGSIGGDQSICYNTVPSKFTSSAPTTGGRGRSDYFWQYSLDNGLTWLNINNSNSAEYTLPIALKQTTKYRRGVSNNCGTAYTTPITVNISQLTNFSIAVSGGNNIGAGSYTYSVNFGGKPSKNMSYVWKSDGVQVSTASSWSVVWNDSDNKLITVEVTDMVSKCSQTCVSMHHSLSEDIKKAGCFITPPVMDWKIEEVKGVSTENICLYQSPMVGDIDGDGIPEITVLSGNRRKILIYKGNNLSTPHKTFAIPMLRDISLTLGLVRTKVSDNKSKTLIIIYVNDGFLRAYDIDGNQIWMSPKIGYFDLVGQTFNFADFNHDGYAEIYFGRKIFDAATGVLLCEGNGNTGFNQMGSSCTYNSAVGDVLGNGELQLVAGSHVYEVKIVNRTSMSGNSMMVVKQLPAFKMEDGTDAPNDGTTVVADMNRDGRLDVVVQNTNFTTGSILKLYVWTPSLDQNGRLLAHRSIPNVATAGMPSIGDIDGDKYPEIVILGGANIMNVSDIKDSIYAFKYISGQTILGRKWGFPHKNTSGFSGLTLFDFNQDGISELVYRDNFYLHIINGSLKSHITGKDTLVYDILPPIDCQSGTASEYPVVADIDGDGHAEIVTGGNTNKNQPPLTETGPLKVFHGGKQTSWASARKVWNQSGFSTAYVKEDLTVPAYTVNPAVFFPGTDGIFGTADDLQPYNNFLRQQTEMSINGTPQWLVPDAKFVEAPPVFVYHGDGDSLSIDLKVTNLGDQTLSAPFHISTYMNTVNIKNLMSVNDFQQILKVGETVKVTLMIHKFSTYQTSISNFIVRLNDSGNAAYMQPECEYKNNTFDCKYDKNMPRAANDTAVALINSTQYVNIKLNDFISPGCSPLNSSIIIVHPVNGKATVDNNNVVTYNPNSDFYGIDSLRYRTGCNLNNIAYYTEAKIYCAVNKPASPSYKACHGSSIPAGFYTVKDLSYYWYSAATGGAPDGQAADMRNCRAPGEWWVETRFRGKALKPRFKLVVEAYSDALYNYPDIRVRICPKSGEVINLSKYIDTLELKSLRWENVSPHFPPISPSGTFSTNTLNAQTKVYTFAYTASNLCVSNIKRMVYLEMLSSTKRQALKDTVEICYEQAEFLNINSILGVEAQGTWSYKSKSPNDVNKYVRQSTSPAYKGSVVMNGKALYEDNSIAYYTYHGITKTKMVEFTFSNIKNSCFKGKVFKIVIILTPKI
jgi:hypothetical protein